MKIHVKDKKPMRRSLLLCIIPMMYTALMIAQDAKPQDSTLKKFDGYIPLYWDSKNGKLLMEIKRFDTEFLYQVSLQTGVGSNPIGLDRGQLRSFGDLRSRRKKTGLCWSMRHLSSCGMLTALVKRCKGPPRGHSVLT